MAAMANTLVDDAAINNVIAYIETFPDTAGTVHRSGGTLKMVQSYTRPVLLVMATLARASGL